MQVFLAISVSTDLGGVECSCLGGSSVWKWGVTVPSHVPTAILGMHTLMSNQQYYQALGSSSIVNKEGLNSEYRAMTAWPRHPAPPHREDTLEVKLSSRFLLPLPTQALCLVAEFDVLYSQLYPPFTFVLLGFVSYLQSSSPSQDHENTFLYFLLKVLGVDFLYATS